jgi:hypothetical protein
VAVVRLPDPLEGLIELSLGVILNVDTREEPSIKAHFGEEARIGARVAERIYVPANAGLPSELLEVPFMTLIHVVDHILIVSAGFVLHAPASIDYFQAALLNELADLSLHIISLIFPPHAQELHLHISELLVRISQ